VKEETSTRGGRKARGVDDSSSWWEVEKWPQGRIERVSHTPLEHVFREEGSIGFAPGG